MQGSPETVWHHGGEILHQNPGPPPPFPTFLLCHEGNLEKIIFECLGWWASAEKSEWGLKQTKMSCVGQVAGAEDKLGNTKQELHLEGKGGERHQEAIAGWPDNES